VGHRFAEQCFSAFDIAGGMAVDGDVGYDVPAAALLSSEGEGLLDERVAARDAAEAVVGAGETILCPRAWRAAIVQHAMSELHVLRGQRVAHEARFLLNLLRRGSRVGAQQFQGAIECAPGRFVVATTVGKQSDRGPLMGGEVFVVIRFERSLGLCGGDG
jgi:hypothetical protein